jgi:energy-coupling factor transport system permease protein
MLVTFRWKKRQSIVQSFDPRAWLIFFICFLGCTVLFWDVRYLVLFFCIAVFVVLRSGISWKEMSRAWIFIGGFIIFFSFLTFLTGRGGIELYKEEHVIAQLQAGFTLLGWRPTLLITAERISYAFSMLVRVFSLASMTVLIPYSLDPSLYGVTFRGLGLPDKISYGMDLTMRFIPTFARDFSLTMDAQKARGYEIEKIKGGFIQQVRKLAPLLIPVTIKALAGSEDIIDAMDLRAFGIGPRTWLVELHYSKRDYALIIFGVMLITAGLALSLQGFGKFWTPQFLIDMAKFSLPVH